MKKVCFILFIVLAVLPLWANSVSGAKSIPIDDEHFPDFYFQYYVERRLDTNRDGKLNEKERNAVTEINVGRPSEYRSDLEYPAPDTLEGIEYFPKLQNLCCSEGHLKELDISKNTELVELDCSDNKIKKLNLKKNKKIEALYCDDNKLQKLDLSVNTKLETLFCTDNQLKEINLLKNKNIKKLLVSTNSLKKLDISKLKKLTLLCCGENQLKKLDVTHNKKLTSLECDTNKLTTLDVSKNKDLDYLHCGDNRISMLDLSKNKLLQTLRCEGNRLITGNVKLSRTQLERCEAATQKATIKRKKIGKYYYIPLPGVLSTNVISNLSYGKLTSRGIRVEKSGTPKTITYEYNMFTDGEEKTKVTIKTKK